jgi:Ca2+/Na+ antiporter
MDLNGTLTALAPSVFAVYMLVASNFLPELMGCRMQSMLRNSMLYKHMLGLLLTLFLVVFANPDFADKSLWYTIFISVAVYVAFMVTTRTPVEIVLLSIFILLVVYIINLRKSKINTNDANTKKANEEKIKNLEFAQNVLVLVALGINLIGFIVYVVEKMNEYGTDFRWYDFVIGTPQCRNFTPINAKIIKMI